MDLLAPTPEIDLHDKTNRIYARNLGMPPQYVASEAQVDNCLITEGSDIHGTCMHAVLSSGAVVESGARVIDSVIMPNARVCAGATVRRAIVAENAVIGPNAVIGEETGKIAVVGTGVTVPADTVVRADEQYGEG